MLIDCGVDVNEYDWVRRLTFYHMFSGCDLLEGLFLCGDPLTLCIGLDFIPAST